MALKLPKRCPGEKRQFGKCLDCGQAQFSDYVPFGLGRGQRFNSCQCQLTSNRTHRLKKITRKEFERLYRLQKRKEKRNK